MLFHACIELKLTALKYLELLWLVVTCGPKADNASVILVGLYVSAFIVDISVVNVIADMVSPPASK